MLLITKQLLFRETMDGPFEKTNFLFFFEQPTKNKILRTILISGDVQGHLVSIRKWLMLKVIRILDQKLGVKLTTAPFVRLKMWYGVETFTYVSNKLINSWSWTLVLFFMFTYVMKIQFQSRRHVVTSSMDKCQRASLVQISISYHIWILRFMQGCTPPPFQASWVMLKSKTLSLAIHKDIFACRFSIHNTISLSCHEQVCLTGLHLNILVNDMINLLYYNI